MTRLSTPICGAARPIPGASYIAWAILRHSDLQVLVVDRIDRLGSLLECGVGM